MKKILFLAPYPTKENEKEGMMSRIKCIDKQFEKKKRAYLNVSLFRRKNIYIDNENVSVYNLNLMLNILIIVRLIFSADLIYCHSLYSIRFLWPIVLARHNCRIVLDIHGVVPDEERYFYKHQYRYYYYRFIEWAIFHKISHAICVTNMMKNVYEKRYRFSKCNYVIYSILPIELNSNQNIIDEEITLNTKVEIIYSGGIQRWQNIDMMMNLISRNLSDNVHYTILTGSVEEVREKAKFLKLSADKVDITSCSSDQLFSYYNKAHYAFILRDESIVNQVANPTKLVEYLFYGLTPIVLSPVIGDYADLGYKYINVQEFDSKNLIPCKSDINRNIALSMLEQNKKINLSNLLFMN